MKINRVLSLLLALVMIFSCVGMAFAAEPEATKSAAFTTYTDDGEMIVGDWLWGDVVAQRGAANVMAEYAKAGITDVYLLVKGTGGKVAWTSSVPGAVMSSNGDVLGPTCEAAKQYGIRVHAWMMAGHDSYYLSNIDSSAMAYHFRYGYGSSVTQRINLRDEGYQEYTRALVEEIVANYDVAGIHLDTMRYGGIWYDWGKNARDTLLTEYGININQYNAATKAMCVTAGYSYTTATSSTAGYNNGSSYTYYCFSSASGTSGNGLPTVLGSSSYGDAYIGARAFLEMRTDSVTNFVKMVGEAAGDDKIISVAIMPEPIGSTYETFVYGQDINKLATCTDYITPMLYATQYAKAASWPASQSKVCAAAGCNVVTGVQAFDETYVSYASDLNAEIPQLMAAAEEVNPDSTTGDILGFAYFRGAFMTMGNAVYDGDNSKLDVYVSNQKNSYWVSTVNDTKLVFKMQNGMTATSVTNLSGFNSGTKATISSDGKTVTIANGGSTVLPGSKAASFTINVTGTPSSTYGAVLMTNYTGSSYSENKGFCMTTILGEEPNPQPTEPTEPTDSTTPVVNDSVLMNFNSGDIASAASDWATHDCTIAVDNSQGIAYGTVSNSDPYITTNGYPFSRKISAGDVVEIRMKTNITSGTPNLTQVFFATTSATNYSEAFSIKATAANYTSNNYQTITFPFSTSGAYIGQTMNKLRLDMVDTTSGNSLAGSYEIDYIYVGPAVYAPSYKCMNGHVDVETWCNGDGTHDGICYECGKLFTDTCKLSQVSGGCSCVGGENGEDNYSLTKGCGYNQATFLFFDFTNTANDQLRYKSPVYGGKNYDLAESWKTVYNQVSNIAVSDGALSYTAQSETHNIYSSAHQTAGTMKFSPEAGMVAQVRFKVEGATADTASANNGNISFSLYATNSDGNEISGMQNHISFADVDGKYRICTFELPASFTNVDPITGLRLGFKYITVGAKVTVDYIYVGPESDMPTQHSYKAVVTAPTCTEQGYTTYTCANCGHSYVDSYVAAHGHEYEVATEGNVETHTCIHCGDSYETVIETEPQPTEPEPTEPEVTEPVNPDAKNGIYLEDGLYYYYVNDQIQYAAGLVCVDGAYYYIRSGGYAAIGEYWCTNTNGITEAGFYIFGEDGKMLLNDTSKNGIYYEGGKYYYYVGGEIGFGAGLVYVDGYYYYIRSGGYATIGEYWVSNTNGLMEEGMYTFGSDGKMILDTSDRTGMYLENGLYYYYVNGEIQYAAGLVFVDGAYYYIRSGGYAATGSYWCTNTNGITEEGFYIFGEDGKMILNDDSKNGIYLEGGLYYYYKDGNIGFGAGLVCVDGAYYYIRSGGYAAIGEYYVSITNGLMPEGMYTFGSDGKMIL